MVEYYQGGQSAGGRHDVSGGHGSGQNLDQAVVVGGRGRPMVVEKVRVNILLLFSINVNS